MPSVHTRVQAILRLLLRLQPWDGRLRERSARSPSLCSLLPVRVTALHASAVVLCAGRQMEDGKGQLADGTRYERSTSEEYGPDGYWLRTTVMRGVSAEGQVRRRAWPPRALFTTGACRRIRHRARG